MSFASITMNHRYHWTATYNGPLVVDQRLTTTTSMIWKPEAILSVPQSRSSHVNVGAPAPSLEFAIDGGYLFTWQCPSLAFQPPTPLLLLLLLASPHRLRHISLAILADMVNVLTVLCRRNHFCYRPKHGRKQF